jgi:hypothetical protein
MEWQPIESALESLPYEEHKVGEKLVRYYAHALVYGPTWEGDFHHSPYCPEKGGGFTGERQVAIAHTWSGKGFWTISAPGPGDYDEYVKPTHWMPLPPPPKENQ